jgi:L-2-hydroxycarboxylate dehydrogenase (NAD+)
MSMIWESINTNSNLPPTVFYDKGGKYTKDPREAKAVKIFGGHKGFGLSFMFQVISGSLIGARMGEKIKDQYDIGYFFMAINPAFFQDINEFKSQNKELIKYIKSSKKEKKQEGIRIPGENSASNLNKVLKSNSIFINEQILKRLDELYLS